MQTQTTIRYHLIPVRMAIIKNTQTINAEMGMQKRVSSYTICANVNWYNYYGEQYGISLKNRTTMKSSNPTPGHISGDNHNVKRCMSPDVHCSTIYNSQDIDIVGFPGDASGKQPTCASMQQT